MKKRRQKRNKERKRAKESEKEQKRTKEGEIFRILDYPIGIPLIHGNTH